ncbi:HlyD family secretion protein [Commensalibacter nepenthis]|uniref:HlyD family secretion protein n=1 Tax=Commensalibacter nepenthis TaxID=3043872 RepID=A0ABT6QAM8_9PROT|nr:HlyD family secretion protein [Commensalibacter sp. TBRC 10068]MDI2113812.1 HlyD family secretion protein [Commensalibacter sp. TBRC 10068]
MTKMKKILLIFSIACCALIAIIADKLLIGNGVTQTTNDAYIVADFTVVAPKISGLIDRVYVEDNQYVHAGQKLAHIDDKDYRTAVRFAEASLKSAEAKADNLSAELVRQDSVIMQAKATVRADNAAVIFAKENATRYHNLSRGGAGTVEQQQKSASQLQQKTAIKERDSAAATAAQHQLAVLKAKHEESIADIARAQAELEQARLNLSYTTILSPIDGMIGQRSVRVGGYVNPGKALMAVVPLESVYIVANFQETQLTHIESGQQVKITVDSLPGKTFNGNVDNIAPANGIAFSPLPPDNATSNFTKVVQRIPVKIYLDPHQGLAKRLRVGMSVEVSINTAQTKKNNKNTF